MIGIHVKRDKGETLERSIRNQVQKYDLKAVQIFTHGPRNLKKTNYDAEEIKEFVEEKKIALIVHSAYQALPWEEKRRKFICKHIVSAMIDVYDVGGRGLVVHLPSKMKHSKVINVLEDIKKRIGNLEPDDLAKIKEVTLILEHKPHKPLDEDENEKSFVVPEALASFLADLKKAEYTPQSQPLRVGFCCDTAHIFVSCEKPALATEKSMKKYLGPLEPHMDMMSALHLNGSYYESGTGRDKHTIPMVDDDEIWGEESIAAIAMLVGTMPNIPIIVEWNIGTEKELKSFLRKFNKLSEKKQ